MMRGNLRYSWNKLFVSPIEDISELYRAILLKIAGDEASSQILNMKIIGPVFKYKQVIRLAVFQDIPWPWAGGP